MASQSPIFAKKTLHYAAFLKLKMLHYAAFLKLKMLMASKLSVWVVQNNGLYTIWAS